MPCLKPEEIKINLNYSGSKYNLWYDLKSILNDSNTKRYDQLTEDKFEDFYKDWLMHGKVTAKTSSIVFRQEVTKVQKTVSLDFKQKIESVKAQRKLFEPVFPDAAVFSTISNDSTNIFETILNQKKMLETENLKLVKDNSIYLNKIKTLEDFKNNDHKKIHTLEEELLKKIEECESLKKTNAKLETAVSNCKTKHKTVQHLAEQLEAANENVVLRGKQLGQSRMINSSYKKKKRKAIDLEDQNSTPVKLKRVRREIHSNIIQVQVKSNESRDLLTGHLYAEQTSKRAQTLLRLQPRSYFSLSKIGKVKRLRKTSLALKYLAGGKKKASQHELQQFFTDLLDKESVLTRNYADLPGKCANLRRLSPQNTLYVKSILGWSNNGLIKTKRVLKSQGLDFLASSKSVEEVKKKMLEPFDFVQGEKQLWKSTKLNDSANYSYTQVDNLKNLVLSSFLEFDGKTEELVTINGRYVVVFAGDKGGSMEGKSCFTKCGFYLLTKDKPQDLAHFRVYMMMDAPDIYENMYIIHQRYSADLKELQNCKVLGKEILVVLNGDFAHLSCMLGHQGCSCTLPSIYTLIGLDHLSKYHKEHNTPHNNECEDCVASDRSLHEMKDNFIENCCNNPADLRAGGKKSESIIGESLFPLKYGIHQQVMAPLLHIVTGTFGDAEDKFILDALYLDNIDKTHRLSLETTRKEAEELIDKENSICADITLTAEDCIELKDVITVLKSPAHNKKTLCVATVCRQPNEKLGWILCNSKHETLKKKPWFHIECEGMTAKEHIVYKDDKKKKKKGKDYYCTACRGNSPEFFDLKLKELESSHEDLEKKLFSLLEKQSDVRITVSSKKSQYESYKGPIYAAIKEEMKNLGIKAEEFYGHIYTGGNAMEFLKNYKAFTSKLTNMEMKAKWNLIFSTLYNISRSLLSTTQLVGKEAEDLKSNIKLMSKIWQQHINQRISIKFDALTMVIPRLVEEFEGYLGAISEQNIERLHNVTNKEARTVHNISNKSMKAAYLIKSLEVSRHAHNSKIAEGLTQKEQTFTCCDSKWPSKQYRECPTCKKLKPSLKRKAAKRSLYCELNASQQPSAP